MPVTTLARFASHNGPLGYTAEFMRYGWQHFTDKVLPTMVQQARDGLCDQWALHMPQGAPHNRPYSISSLHETPAHIKDPEAFRAVIRDLVSDVGPGIVYFGGLHPHGMDPLIAMVEGIRQDETEDHVSLAFDALSHTADKSEPGHQAARALAFGVRDILGVEDIVTEDLPTEETWDKLPGHGIWVSDAHALGTPAILSRFKQDCYNIDIKSDAGLAQAQTWHRAGFRVLIPFYESWWDTNEGAT